LTRLVPPWQPMKVVKETESLANGEAILGLPGGLRCVLTIPVRRPTQFAIRASRIKGQGGPVPAK